jgi:HK97 family phage major capsid protein
MNLEALIKKRGELLATVNTKLSEASAALADGNMESVKSIHDDIAKYEAQVEAYTTQIKAMRSVEDAEDFSAQPAQDNPTKSEPVRMPFDVDTDDNPDSDGGYQKAVQIVRFGDVDANVKMLARDLYGDSYMQKRYDQQKAFVKYLRRGDNLDGEERALLNQLIMTPEQIRQDVVEDTDFKSIKATVNETSNELGGYLVPEDYRLQIVKKMQDNAIVRSQARVIQTSRDAVEWPKLLGGDDRYTSAVRVTWVDENPSNESVAETNPNFGMVRIPVHTVMARIDLSRNQLEDSAFNMIEMMAELFGEAAAIDEDVQFVTGRGGNTPRGVLGRRSGAEYLPLYGIETVELGGSAAMTPDGVIDLIYSLPQQYRRNAKLLGSRLTHGAIRKFKDADNQYLWEPALRAGEPPTVLGYEFAESESMPDTAASAYPLVFADWSGYVIVDRIGMSVERVTDSITTGRNKVALFMRRRLGGDVIEEWKFKAGQQVTN